MSKNETNFTEAEDITAIVARSSKEIETLLEDRLSRITPDEAIELACGNPSQLASLAQQIKLAHVEAIFLAAATIQRRYHPDETPSDELISKKVLDARMQCLDEEVESFGCSSYEDNDII